MDQKSSGVMLKEETGAFIVAVRRGKTGEAVKSLRKFLRSHASFVTHVLGKSADPCLPWKHGLVEEQEEERRLCSPRHVYQEDAGRDILALYWNPTVQNAPCVEKEEVRRSRKYRS